MVTQPLPLETSTRFEMGRRSFREGQQSGGGVTKSLKYFFS